MPDWLIVIMGIVGGAAGTLIMGALSSALWDWVRDTISIPSPTYVHMRGTWEITSSHEIDGASNLYKERLVIRQQFGRRFRGALFSPHPTVPTDMIELDVRAEFRDKFHVLFTYEHRTLKLTDVGAGTFQVSPDHETAEGASVNFGVSSPNKPTIIKFRMTKVR